MKRQDDYHAKVRLWAGVAHKTPRLPIAEGFPNFSKRRFSSYAEMNAWKRGLIMETVRKGGVRWKKS